MNHELSELLAYARMLKMNRDEVQAQQRSWVIGQLMLTHPEWTREKAEAIYDKALGE